MFQEFLDSIVQSTQSQYIEPILKLCGYGEIAHFYKFTDYSVDLIEKYVQNRLSAMPVEERAPIIGNDFADFPAYFMFTPIFRINLVKTISLLVKQFENKISKKRNKTDFTLTKDEVFKQLTTNETIFPSKLEERNENTNFTASNSSTVEKPNNTEQFYKYDAPNSVYEKVLKNTVSKFPDVQLNKGKDFELEEWFDEETNKKVYGAYVCRLCEKENGKEKRIRFSYIGQSSIIYTNIQAHLKIHFGKAQSAKKRRWTTANLLD